MVGNLNSTWRRRTVGTLAAAAVAVTSLQLGPMAMAATEADLTLTPNPAYTGAAFQGWGTSLVWMANATGNYPQELKDELIEKVFGDEGLNLNIARYNVGGGNSSDTPDYLRPGGAVPGWWNAETGLSDGEGAITSNYADRDRLLAAWTGDEPSNYNLDADAAQREWIKAIKDKVTKWEAFSNSPPYFMTESGYTSGGFDANADQIKPEAMPKFAKYLKTAMEEVEASEGIKFDTVNPLNEPNTNYWSTKLNGSGKPTGGGQEGAHAGPWSQSQMLSAMVAELAKGGTTTAAKVSGPDETSPSTFVTDWDGWSAETKAQVSQLNVHTYSTGDRNRVRDIAKAANKPLWMSEVEGNWGGDSWNPDSIDNGLGIASRITDDLRELESDAWVLWQPVEDLYNMELGEKKNWGSVFVDFDCNAQGNSVRRVAAGAADPSCKVMVNSKYNTLRNFTHYIVPGDRIIPTNNNKTTSALKQDGSGLTMVHTNDSASPVTVKVDLSRFATVSDGATVTPVVTTESPSGDPTANALVKGDAVVVDAAAKSALVTLPAKSVTTLLVDGVTGVATDAPALQDGKTYSIVGQQSNKSLTATDKSPATVLGDSTEAATQLWTATRIVAGDGTSRDTFALRLADGRTLGADGNSTVLREATDEDVRNDESMQWIQNTPDGGQFNLLNAGNGQVLDVADQSTSSGATVGLWSSNWGANQNFRFELNTQGVGSYGSFRPGQEWLDTSGKVIQAHGGQVVPSKDASGRDIYYLFGEDRSNGYKSSPGVHAYSSYDLYNWKDEGVALKAMNSPEQFENDPYYKDLYGSYTPEQKAAVYRDLGTVQRDTNVNPAILERPKVIFNEATGKWVMWLHADGPSSWSNAQYAKANAGVAVSDSPFGPFKYIDSYRLHRAAADDPTNKAPNNPGMARDMTLFVDKDGTGYIIYSSEENQTLFISKLNAEYTDLSASPETAVEGVDYRRAFVGWSRESPAIFNYNDRYYVVTSGTTGWNPNPSKVGTASSLLGEWTDLGDPFPGDSSWNSFNSQPTNVIPVDAEAGKFIYMGDRWNGGSDWGLANAQMVWLPIQMGENGDSVKITTPSEWKLEDLSATAAWTVTGVPATLDVGQPLDTQTVTVTQDGKSTQQAVQWKLNGSTALPGTVAATGTLPDFGSRTFTRTIAVVPAGLKYAVNAGGQETSDWKALMAAAGAGQVLNSAADQQLGADPVTGKVWGYESEASNSSGTASGDMFSTLRYAAGGRDINYTFSDLAPGKYTVFAGYADPWAQWDDRGGKVTVNGTVVEADHDYDGTNQTGVYKDVVVGADGKLKYSLSPTRGPDVQLSWLMIAATDVAAPEPTLEVAVAASSKCVGGKNLLTVKATNNESVPVALTFTSAFGDKTFAPVLPGKNAVHAFSTRSVDLPAGAVSMQAQAVVDGATVTVDIDAPYGAASCK